MRLSKAKKRRSSDKFAPPSSFVVGFDSSDDDNVVLDREEVAAALQKVLGCEKASKGDYLRSSFFCFISVQTWRSSLVESAQTDTTITKVPRTIQNLCLMARPNYWI